MTKLIFPLVAASLLSFSLSGCGGGSGIRNEPQDRTVSQPRRGSY